MTNVHSECVGRTRERELEPSQTTHLCFHYSRVSVRVRPLRAEEVRAGIAWECNPHLGTVQQKPEKSMLDVFRSFGSSGEEGKRDAMMACVSEMQGSTIKWAHSLCTPPTQHEASENGISYRNVAPIGVCATACTGDHRSPAQASLARCNLSRHHMTFTCFPEVPLSFNYSLASAFACLSHPSLHRPSSPGQVVSTGPDLWSGRPYRPCVRHNGPAHGGESGQRSQCHGSCIRPDGQRKDAHDDGGCYCCCRCYSCRWPPPKRQRQRCHTGSRSRSSKPGADGRLGPHSAGCGGGVRAHAGDVGGTGGHRAGKLRRGADARQGGGGGGGLVRGREGLQVGRHYSRYVGKPGMRALMCCSWKTSLGHASLTNFRRQSANTV